MIKGIVKFTMPFYVNDRHDHNHDHDDNDHDLHDTYNKNNCLRLSY
ncbi:MAG TPA: hypothetical protein VK559_00345 [Ferruginibacter sp.]|nr:hypothetical protein [Ferruginibacter sp.]